jgi:hypothetical protein
MFSGSHMPAPKLVDFVLDQVDRRADRRIDRTTKEEPRVS